MADRLDNMSNEELKERVRLLEAANAAKDEFKAKSKAAAKDLANEIIGHKELAKIKQDNIVVQAPGLTCCAHKLNLTKKDLIIYMHRSWVDILKSWIRVSDRDVTTEWLQKKTVERYLSHDKNFKQFLKYDDIYLNFRIQCWLEYQKPKCINAIELDYESMSNHPIWMQKESRRQFRKKQTQAL